jgi:hypothetical protein
MLWPFYTVRFVLVWLLHAYPGNIFCRQVGMRSFPSTWNAKEKLVISLSSEIQAPPASTEFPSVHAFRWHTKFGLTRLVAEAQR